jgi:hypothetical protein
MIVVIVIAHLVLIIKLMKNTVDLVTMLVPNVLLIILVLMNVPTQLPESNLPLVHVWITTMIVVSLYVVLVNPNVTSVLNLHQTVLFVLLIELTRQNVTFLHEKLKLLELKIFQSVPLPLLFVTVNVVLVNKMLLTV